MSNIQVGIVVGSLRKESFNRKLANAISKIAPKEVSFNFIEIGNLPLYNQDDDAHQADSVNKMKSEIDKCDGIIFVTPEYNRSIPGVLKNAIDHGSRPAGQSVWGKKPAGVIGISQSPVGTALAQQHLRAILATLDMPTLGQPEMFLQMKSGFFDESGDIGEQSREFVKKWIVKFVDWINLHKSI